MAGVPDFNQLLSAAQQTGNDVTDVTLRSRAAREYGESSPYDDFRQGRKGRNGASSPCPIEESQLTDDDAEEFLSSNRHELMEGIQYNLSGVIAWLRTKHVFSNHDDDNIQNTYVTKFQKAGHLLDIVLTRGLEGFKAFMETLQYETPHLYLRITGKEAKKPPEGTSRPPNQRPSTGSWEMVIPVLRMLDQMNERTAEYKQKITELTENLVRAQQTSEWDQQRLDKELHNVNKKLVDIKLEAVNIEKQYLREKEERLKLAEELQDMRTCRDKQMEKINQQQQEIEELLKQIAEVKGTMVLQSSFKTSPEQVRKMKDDIKALKVENTSLKLLTPRTLDKSVDTELKQLQATVARLEYDKEQNSDEMRDMKFRLIDSDLQRQSLETQCETLRHQTQEMQRERDLALSRCRVIEGHEGESRRSCHELQQAIHYYQQKSESLQDQIEEMHYKQHSTIMRRECVNAGVLRRRGNNGEPTSAPVRPRNEDPFADQFKSFYGKQTVRCKSTSDTEIDQGSNTAENVNKQCDETAPGLMNLDPRAACRFRPRDRPALALTSLTHTLSNRREGFAMQDVVHRITQKNKQLITPFSLQSTTAKMFGAQVELFDLKSGNSLRQSASLVEENATFLQNHVTLLGGNMVGIFVSAVDNTNRQEHSQLKTGDQIITLTQKSDGKIVELERQTLEMATYLLQGLGGQLDVIKSHNASTYHQLCSMLTRTPDVFTGDFFCQVVGRSSNWSRRYIDMPKGSIVLVTNSQHKENGWLATELNPVNGDLVLAMRGIIPSGDKFRHHPVIKGNKRGSSIIEYTHVCPHKAVHKRPLMVFTTNKAHQDLCQQLVKDEIFVRFEPACPANGICSSTEEQTEKQKQWAAQLARMMLKNKLHFLLHTNLESLVHLHAIQIFPIILLITPDSGPDKQTQEMEKALQDRFLAFQYDILEVPQEKLSSAGLLAAEVKGRVSTLQEHVIWLET